MEKFKPQSYVGGTIHHFDSQLVAYEYPKAKAGFFSTKPVNSLVFVTGLFGALFTTKYVKVMASALPPDWRLVEPELSSSRLGFGVGSIQNDVAEVAKLVNYLQTVRPSGKVVLMGHSTGCQDALYYTSGEITEKERNSGSGSRPPVHGIILQAPVSDRVAMEDKMSSEELDKARKAAEQLVAEGRSNDTIPRALTGVLGHAPIAAARWLSLTSPGPDHKGEEDMFSHDLPTERLASTFGAVNEGVRILAILSGVDQFVPPSVDQSKLVNTWRNATAKGGGIWDEASGVLNGADHAMDFCEKAVVNEFIKRVSDFLERVASSA